MWFLRLHGIFWTFTHLRSFSLLRMQWLHKQKNVAEIFYITTPPRKSNLFHAMKRRQKDPHLSLSTKISFYICVHKVSQNSIKTKVFGDNQQWIMLALWSEIKFHCVLIHASEVKIYSFQTEYITRSSSINSYYYISAYFSFELKLKSNPVGRRIFFWK